MAELTEYSVSNDRDLAPYAHLGKSGQLTQLEPFRTVLAGVPTTSFGTLKVSDFLKYVDAIPEAMRRWKNAADTVLLGLLSESSSEPVTASKGKEKELDSSVLYLATTLFLCKWCSELQCYPAVLHHKCLVQNQTPGMSKEPVLWNEDAKQVSFDKLLSECSSNIVKALDQDPETVTWLDVEEQNGRVECLRCPTTSAMTWRDAVHHLDLFVDNSCHF